MASRCAPSAARHEDGDRLHDENFEVQFDAYLLRYRGQVVRLTAKELELFRYMVERPGRVVTRERLLEDVWGYEADVDTRSIDVHVRRLRMKLGDGRDHVEMLVGFGYRFMRTPNIRPH